MLLFLQKTCRAINSWIEYFLFALGFTMVVVVAMQVFFRYVLNQSLFWAEELARFLLVWLTFLGISTAYYRKAHPGIDVIYTIMPCFLKRSSLILVHMTSIVLFTVMVFFGFSFSWFVRSQISPALEIPIWIILIIIPLSGLILFVHCITFLMEDLFGWRQ